MAKIEQEKTRGLLRTYMFSLSTDGGSKRLGSSYPVLVYVYDPAIGRVVWKILSLGRLTVTQRANAENIIGLLDTAMNGLSWQRVMALGADNTNVMKGNLYDHFTDMVYHKINLKLHVLRRSNELCVILITVFHYLDSNLIIIYFNDNNLMGYLLIDISGHITGLNGRINEPARCKGECHFAGCITHLQSLTAKAGAAQLAYDISELLIDIYFYLSASSVRKGEVAKFYADFDMPVKDFLKHSPSRYVCYHDSPVHSC